MPADEAKSRLEHAVDGLRTAGWEAAQTGIKVFEASQETARPGLLQRLGGALRGSAAPSPAGAPLDPEIPAILQPRSLPSSTAGRTQEVGHVEARFGVALERHLRQVAPELISNARREYLWIIRNFPEAGRTDWAKEAAEKGNDSSMRFLRAVTRVSTRAPPDARQAYRDIVDVLQVRQDGAANSFGQFYKALVKPTPEQIAAGRSPVPPREAMRRLEEMNRRWDEYFDLVRAEISQNGGTSRPPR